LKIEEATEELKKNRHLYDWATYYAMRTKIIEELELAKNSKYKLTIYDENSFSYKLIF
jgi:hypothetical protein